MANCKAEWQLIVNVSFRKKKFPEQCLPDKGHLSSCLFSVGVWRHRKKRLYSPQCRSILICEHILLDGCWRQTLSFIFYSFPKTWTNIVPQLYLVLIQSLESLWFLSLNCVLLHHNPSHLSWDEWELLLLQIEWTLLYLWHPSNTALVILLLNSAPLFSWDP